VQLSALQWNFIRSILFKFVQKNNFASVLEKKYEALFEMKLLLALCWLTFTDRLETIAVDRTVQKQFTRPLSVARILYDKVDRSTKLSANARQQMSFHIKNTYFLSVTMLMNILWLLYTKQLQ